MHLGILFTLPVGEMLRNFSVNRRHVQFHCEIRLFIMVTGWKKARVLYMYMIIIERFVKLFR